MRQIPTQPFYIYEKDHLLDRGVKMPRRKRHSNLKFKNRTSEKLSDSNDVKQSAITEIPTNKYVDPEFRAEELKRIKDLLEKGKPQEAMEALDPYLNNTKEIISERAAQVMQTYAGGKISANSNVSKPKDPIENLREWMVNLRKESTKTEDAPNDADGEGK